jgi:hypothetical protein
VPDGGHEAQNRHFSLKSKKTVFHTAVSKQQKAVKFIEEKPLYLLYFRFVSCIFSPKYFRLLLPG